MAEKTIISIVVTAYTTERLNDIYELLDSINAQTYPHVELLFVAERSKELLQKVSEYIVKHKVAHAKVLFNAGERGLSQGRNLGIRQATGDIIAFVDDDTVLFPEWAAETVKAYQDDAIIGVTGPALPRWEDDSMSWFPQEFYWIISCTGWNAWQEVREVRNAWGMNMSFRREVFDNNLFSNKFGYHVGSMAEDNEFSLRVKKLTGKKIIYSPETKLWHRVHKYRLKPQFIRERAYWIGISRRNLKRYGKEVSRREGMLQQENDLIKRILFHFSPNVIKTAFRHPVSAWRQVSVASNALIFVVLGYFSIPRHAHNLRRQTDMLQNIKET